MFLPELFSNIPTALLSAAITKLFYYEPLLFETIFLAVFLGYWEARSVRRKWIWVPEIMGMTFLFLLVLGTLIKI
jgi:hypothetical protein